MSSTCHNILKVTERLLKAARERERERKSVCEREREKGRKYLNTGQPLSVIDVFCCRAAWAFAPQLPRAREVTEILLGKIGFRKSVILDVSPLLHRGGIVIGLDFRLLYTMGTDNITLYGKNTSRSI